MGVVGLTYIFDSREKKNEHIFAYFDRHSIPYIVQKLDVGDYAYEGSRIAVDRKQNLEEVARNLTNRSDSSRFWREVRRAHQSGIKLVVLVEHGSDIKTINDVAKWHSKWTRVSGRYLIDIMTRLELSYGVEWRFCSKRSTAKRIIEILKEDINCQRKIRRPKN